MSRHQACLVVAGMVLLLLARCCFSYSLTLKENACGRQDLERQSELHHRDLQAMEARMQQIQGELQAAMADAARAQAGLPVRPCLCMLLDLCCWVP